MRAYERFMRDAGKPIGTVVSIIIASLFLVWLLGGACNAALSKVAAREEYNEKCTMLGGYVTGIADSKFCIDATPVPGIVWGGSNTNTKTEKYQVTNDCLAVGGRILDLSSASSDKGCYTYTIFEELGAKP